jgi:hypothetical protein
MIADALPTTPTLADIAAAFEFDDAYEVILALHMHVREKQARLGLHFDDLSPEEQMVYHALWYDAEVAHGGLLEFFLSEKGDHTIPLLLMLRTIGACQNHRLFARVLALFPDGRPATNRFERARQLSGRFRDLRTLDDTFCFLAEDVPTLAAEYLKKHQIAFL